MFLVEVDCIGLFLDDTMAAGPPRAFKAFMITLATDGLTKGWNWFRGKGSLSLRRGWILQSRQKISPPWNGIQRAISNY